MDITTATPVEIDTEIARLYDERYRQLDIAEREWGYVRNIVAIVTGARSNKVDVKTTRAWLQDWSEISEDEEMQAEAYPDGYTRRQARSGWEHYLKALDAETAADEAFFEIEPLNAEYIRRGRWNRAFLVTNGNGHVHSSMNCGTCYPTTRYYWVTSLSDHDEAEIVEAAGERACTVCYPSAPVGVKGTSLYTPDEVEKQKARAEREAKRAAKDAAKIRVTGLQGWTNAGRGVHEYPTTRGATNAIAGWLSSIAVWNGSHPTMDEWVNNIARVREALEAKGVEYDFAKAVKAASKKGHIPDHLF